MSVVPGLQLGLNECLLNTGKTCLDSISVPCSCQICLQLVSSPYPSIPSKPKSKLDIFLLVRSGSWCKFKLYIICQNLTKYNKHLACVLNCFSCIRLFVTLWIVAHQAPLSVGFSRQEYWSGLPCPPPEDLPNPGIEPASLTSPAFQVGSLPLVPPGKPQINHIWINMI